MRRNGEVTSAGGLLPFGHLGWGYRGQDEYDAGAAAYLSVGLALGQWVAYIGEGERELLDVRLKALPAGAEALVEGKAGVLRIDDVFACTAPGLVDPEATVERLVAATQDALDRGFTGVRLIADATSLVRTAAQRAVFARFEHLVDRQMALLPVSALCAYDLGELDGAVAAELLCLHPFTRPGASGFRLFATEEGGLALAGELDLATRALFEATLQRLEPAFAQGEVTLDLGAVDYLEHNALVALDALADRHGTSLRLRSQDPSLAHMVELLGLGHLGVDQEHSERSA